MESEENVVGNSQDEPINQPKGNGITVPPEIEEILNELPPTERGPVEIISKMVAHYEHEMHVGPLPAPRTLKEYNDINPGFSEAILQQFVSQGDHRRHLEQEVIRGDVRRANWGLVCGTLITIVALVGSFYVISKGHGVEGVAGIILALGTLVGALVYSVYNRRVERNQKAEDVPEKATEASGLDSPK